MAIFKCKMCGGALEISEGSSVAICSFCGTKQTLPKLDDETRINLYDRANHFRRNNDYDKAMSIYEQLLNIDKTDAEAYWSILLCKYGVAYVEDPKTHKMLPTINRTQYTSIFADEDYKSAIDYADGYQKEVYEAEAKELDAIQKGILAISRKEEPFDVFICYKESDNFGRRTQDSVLAQELYYQLTQEGFKVFFSRITLEDKLGTAYEPYIFAALNTAKVMVVIGTSRDNLNSVWVKNEWSRFLALTKANNKKVLIPAYRDMDPYDLPDEFSHLQAQDMSKLGFMQDLIRGIKKITEKDETIARINIAASTNNTNINALLKRAYIACEDGDFEKADNFAEQILNIDPEFSEAYVIKLLAECGVQKLSSLKTFPTIIKGKPNFQRAYKYAVGEQKSNLAAVGKENAEFAIKQPTYSKGVALINKGKYQTAIDTLLPIKEYKDSEDKIKFCQEKLDLKKKEGIYKNALAIGFANDANDFTMLKAIGSLKTIEGYKDSAAKIDELYARVDKWRYQQKVKAEKEKEEAIRRSRRRKIGAITFTACAAIITLVLTLTFSVFVPLSKYNKAENYIASENYSEAISIYEDLDDYKDSETHKNNLIMAQQAMQYFAAGYLSGGVKYLNNNGCKAVVTYNCNGGEISYHNKKIESETITDISKLRTPYRKGYVFLNWRIEKYDVVYDMHEVTANLVIKANWLISNYSIDYDLDGGKINGTNPVSYRYDSSDITIKNPTKAGYTFAGWSGTDIDGKTKTLTIPSGSVGDRSYKANWTPKEYVIRFDANGGTMSSSTMLVTYNKQFKLPIPTKDGYTFFGWSIMNDESIIEDGIWNIADNVKLYAQWDLTTYNISYDLNGGTVSSINPFFYTIISDEFTLQNPTRQGYTFIGWSGETIDGLSTKVTVNKGSFGNRVYTANWNANTYTITYDANGGQMSSTTQTVTYDEKYTLYSASMNGYYFVGWYDENDNLFPDGIWNRLEDVSLKAKWSANKNTRYTVNHYLENADNSEYTLYLSEALEGETATSVTPAVKTYSHFSSPSKKTITIAPDGTGVVNYYYTRNRNNLTLYPNNGGSAITKTFKYSQRLDKNSWVSFDNHVFDGWYTDSALVNVYSNSTMGDESLSLYAYWKGDSKPTAFSYEETNSTISITGYKGYSKNVVVPSYINNKKVTDISSLASSKISTLKLPQTILTIGANAFEGCTDLSSVDIPVNVTSIGNSAFKDCTGLKGISMSDKVTSIGNYAFYGCSSLTSIIIPDSVTSIGSSAFSGCSSLEIITIPFVGANAGVTSKNTYQYPFGYIFGTLSYVGGVKTTQYYYGSSTSSTTSSGYYIPSSLKSVTVTGGNILYGAFYNCSNIESITFPKNITNIDSRALYKCSGLTKITIPENVTTIGTSAFQSCTGLSSVNWNATECTIAGALSYPIFGGCTNLSTINIGNKVTVIPSYAFKDCTALTSIEVPDNVGSIGDSAFSGCGNLETITIPFVGAQAGVTSKNTYQYPFGYIFGTSSYAGGVKTAQYYYGSSTSSRTSSGYYIPSSLKFVIVTGGNILYGAFYNCGSIEDITLPKNVTSIDSHAFYECSSLQNINIPKTVTSIGNHAFYKCNGLADITIPESVTTIGNSAFYGCIGLSSVNWNAAKCTSAGAPANPIFGGCTNLTTINIGNKVTTIPSDAFRNCTALSSIEIPYGVTNIDYGAFAYCTNLKSIVIPKSVTSIGYYVFEGCSSLESITIPFVGAKAGVTSNDTYQYPFGYIFGTSSYTGGVATKQYYYGDSTSSTTYSTYYIPSPLKSVTVTGGNILYGAFYNCSELTSITLGNGVTSIESYAFFGCSRLTSVIISKSVTSIGSFIFSSDCTDLVIKYQGESIPDTWNKNWNAHGYTVQFIGKD